MLVCETLYFGHKNKKTKGITPAWDRNVKIIKVETQITIRISTRVSEPNNQCQQSITHIIVGSSTKHEL